MTTWVKQAGRMWQALAAKNGVLMSLGLHSTPERAEQACRDAEALLGDRPIDKESK